METVGPIEVKLFATKKIQALPISSKKIFMLRLRILSKPHIPMSGNSRISLSDLVITPRRFIAPWVELSIPIS
jgi:hypothetical protein